MTHTKNNQSSNTAEKLKIRGIPNSQ